MSQTLFDILGCTSRESLKNTAKLLGTTTSILQYYNDSHVLPSAKLLDTIEEKAGINQVTLMLKMGIYSPWLMNALSKYSDQISPLLPEIGNIETIRNIPDEPSFTTEYGQLYNLDCIKLLSTIESESIDLVFADPPFNLNKFYKSEINDSLHDKEYFDWCIAWIDESIRVLKPGGSLFIWNLPKWNSKYAQYIHDRLNFRHWIATDIKTRLPIKGRLYPAHYSLLYFIKGPQPNVFEPDRMPMEVCPKCYNDLKDYGGYKNKMNPLGVNLTDVWYDIPPVRHKKHKKREEANELSIKLLDRIIELSTNENDIIFDPFGGAGTTYIVAELKKRRWIGTELGPVDTIIDRFSDIQDEAETLCEYRNQYNKLFPHKIKEKRKKLNLWTDETFSQ